MISKDIESLSNSYLQVIEKQMNKDCKCNCKNCKCRSNRNETEKVEEAKKKASKKPDYLDLDKDGDTDETMKKAAEDLKEHKSSFKFKELYNTLMSK